jgi:hypothetical protein
VKCVDGSPILTHGIVEARIELTDSSVAHKFHLVSKQVDIPCDGILGRDFLQKTNAKICYASRTITVNGETCAMVGNVNKVRIKEPVAKTRGLIKLPPRSESIVRVPATPESPNIGVTNKYEVREGVFMAASLTKVIGHILTSMLNTNDVEVEVSEPVIVRCYRPHGGQRSHKIRASG